jgi:WD40 repeat protein
MVLRGKFICSLLTLLLNTIIISSQAHELTVQTGHSLAITDLAFSPDNKYLISSGDDNHVIVWDIISGKQVRILEGHTGPVNQICIHPTKDILASVSDDKTVCLWDYKNGYLIRQIPIETEYLKTVGFIEEGQKLVVAGEGVYIIDLESYIVTELPGIPSGQIFECISTSPDKIAIGGRKGKVLVYDLPGKQVEKSYSLICSELGLGQDDRYLVGAGLSGKLRRWDLTSDLSRMLKLSIPSDKWIDSYHAVALSGDNRYFAGGNRNKKIYVYDIHNAKTHLVISGHDEKVTALAFSPDNRFIASAGPDRIIRLWNMDNGQWVKTFHGFIGAITSISANESEGVLALGDNTGYCGIVELRPDGRIYSTKYTTGHIQDFLGWKVRIEDVKFNPKSKKMMVEASLIKEIKHKNNFDLKTKPEYFMWDFSTDKITRIAQNQPGQLLANKGFILFDRKKSESENILLSEDGKLNSKKNKIPDNLPARAQIQFIREDDQMKYCIYGYHINDSEHWQLYEMSDRIMQIEGELSSPLEDAIFTNDHLILKTHDNDILVYSTVEWRHLFTCHGNGPVEASGNVLYIASGKDLQIYDLNNGNKVLTLQTTHSSGITSFNTVVGQNRLVTGSADGSLRFWDIPTQKEVFRLVVVPPDDRILISPDNYYMATKGALKGVGFTVGPEVYSFEQFDLIYNRPDKVLVNTGLADTNLVNNYRMAYLKRLKKLGKSERDLQFQREIPEIELHYEPDILSTKTGNIHFTLTGKASENNLDRLHILVNGVPEYGKLGMPIDISSSRQFETNISLDMSYGLNDIQVYVSDVKGVSSLRKDFQVNYTIKETKPDLYLVAIGTSRFEQSDYNLTYAAKDAKDVTNVLNKSEAFKEIHTLLIRDEEVTLDRIKTLPEFIGKAGVNDVVIIFIAGHGILNRELDYYLSTFDIDFMNPEKRGIPYNELEDLLDQTRSRKKVLFMDACHSGELDKEEMELSYTTKTEAGDITFREVGPQVQYSDGIELESSFELSKILFADMRNNNGATVVSSAGGAEYALEGQQWNNGVFTFCFLDGITENKADRNKDGKIMLSELQDYINHEVPKLTNERQTPTSRIENLSNDFRIW